MQLLDADQNKQKKKKKVPIQLQRTWFKVKHFVFMRTANVCGAKVI